MNVTRSGLRRPTRILGAAAVAVVALTMTATPAGAAPPQTCTGDLESPGVLAPSYAGNLMISGVCAALAGTTVVNGNVTVLPGSTLAAAFGSGKLVVNGNVVVQKDGTLILGCNTSSFTCIDEPNNEEPTLSSHPTVFGNVIANQPLSVIVHSATIGGNVSQSGGGGGVTCDQFSPLGFPYYSDYEDNAIGGNLVVSGLDSCWLGMARDTIGGNLLVLGNQLADPDAIEILSNTISGNLVCQRNSMVWDSADLSETGLYPRGYEPNTVNGQRVGQCVTAPAITPGGSSPGPF